MEATDLVAGDPRPHSHEAIGALRGYTSGG